MDQFLNVVDGGTYAGVPKDRLGKRATGLIEYKPGSFGLKRECIDEIFTLKRLWRRALKKKHSAYFGYIGLEKS